MSAREDLEKGDAVLEMAAVVPAMLLIVAFILLIGPYIRVQIATDQAAYDCAMAAAQSLDAGQGQMQGAATAQSSFQTFDLRTASMSVRVFGSWERDGQVGCSVSYSMPLGAFPFVRVANVPGVVTNTTVLPVQFFKSEWTDG